MRIEELMKYTKNINCYMPSEIKDLEEMTDIELDKFQNELEYETGNLSDWDKIRAVISFRKRINDLEIDLNNLRFEKEECGE